MYVGDSNNFLPSVWTSTPGQLNGFNTAIAPGWGYMVCDYAGSSWKSFFCPNLAGYHPNRPVVPTSPSADYLGYTPWQYIDSWTGSPTVTLQKGFENRYPFMADNCFNWGTYGGGAEDTTRVRCNGHKPQGFKDGANSLYYDGHVLWFKWNAMISYYVGWWMRPPND